MADDLIRLMHAFFLPATETFRRAAWRPATDVYRTREGWLVKFELAGVRPEDINLTVHGRCLTVRGVRRDCSAERDYCCYVMEITYDHFERTVELPCEVEAAPLAVDFHLGMLVVRIQTGGNP
jgi:HSP20 family protein